MAEVLTDRDQGLETPQLSEKTARDVYIDRAINWGEEISTRDYTYKWYGSTDHMCPICHPETPDQGFNCIGFVCACWGHGAGDQLMLKHCRENNGRALGGDLALTLVTERSWRRRNGPNWNMIKIGRKNGPSIPLSMLQRGDVVLGYTDSGRYVHTMLYRGDGTFIDSRSDDVPQRQVRIRTYEEETCIYHLTRAFRYVWKEG